MPELAAVIDTAPLLAVLAGNGAMLGRETRHIIRRVESGRSRIAVPIICLFEVGQLEERGRIHLELPFEGWCDLVESNPGLLLLPLERPHVSEARALPTLRDPFDRLIAGTAVAIGLPLITPDDRIAKSGRLRVIW